MVVNRFLVDILNYVSFGQSVEVDVVANGQIHLMLITSSGGDLDQKDGRQLRHMALAYKVPIITSVARAFATAEGSRA